MNAADELQGRGPLRGMNHFLRALWGMESGVSDLPASPGELLADARPRFTGSQIWLPALPLGCLPCSFSDYVLAASAHASAHIRFGAAPFRIGELKPIQVAIISLLEDARVERLAVLRYPGLKRLWTPFHMVPAEGGKSSSALLARLARALHDNQFVDGDAWVRRGREQFDAQPERWRDPSWLRQLGGALGNDLGQMRVQFDAAAYVVQPAYRDDNVGLWQREPAEDRAALQSEAARSSENGAHRGERDGEQGQAETSRSPGQAAAQQSLDHSSHGAPVFESPSRYPEWDYVIARERAAFCSVFERAVELGDARRIDAALAGYARTQRRLERSAQNLASRHPIQVRRLLDGDHLDLTSAIGAIVARAGGASPEPRVYRRVRFELEPPALLLLLDLSASTSSTAPGATTTLLELARNASALLAASLQNAAPNLAIHGFSSNGRQDVGYYRFKNFDEPYDERARARLAGMRAGLSTRLGPALRHAGQELRKRPARRKLLLVLTDGEPADIDVYDPKYLLFDAKRATEQNRALRVTSFCVGLDRSAAASVKSIFGARNCMVFDQLGRLPQRLSELYLRLAG
jgi:hypothetical protein